MKITARSMGRAASALAVIGTLTLAGCAASPDASGTPSADSTDNTESTDSPSQEPVTITFMEAMSSGKLKDALVAATDRFQDENPHITVELLEQPDYGTLNTKIEAEVAAGNAPTLAQVYSSWAVNLADAGVIVPLDDRIEKSDAYDTLYAGVQNDLTLADGQRWMWPFNKSLFVQYYNTTLVPEAPTTWEEFADVTKAISTDGVVGVSVDPGGTSGIGQGSVMVEITAESNGGSMFDDKGEPTFTDPEVVKSLEYYVGLKEAGALATGTKYPGQQALGAGTGGFDLSSVASLGYNLEAIGGKFEMGVAALPEGSKGSGNSLSGTNVALFADATPEQQDAAWEYLQFLTSPAEMAQWASTTGYLPVTKDAVDEPVYKTYIEENPWVTGVLEQLEEVKVPVPQPWTTEAQGLFAAAVSEALSGAATPKDALEKAQTAAERLVS